MAGGNGAAADPVNFAPAEPAPPAAPAGMPPSPRLAAAEENVPQPPPAGPGRNMRPRVG